MFQNPGHGRHWLKVKLVSVKSNRSALGARIEVERKNPNRTTVSVVQVVGNNDSFGGNPLVQHSRLGDATSVTRLVVTWPTSQTTQTFTGLAAEQSIVITEGSDQYQVLPQKPSTTPAGK